MIGWGGRRRELQGRIALVILGVGLLIADRGATLRSVLLIIGITGMAFLAGERWATRDDADVSSHEGDPAQDDVSMIDEPDA
jgi:hypothetical protein